MSNQERFPACFVGYHACTFPAPLWQSATCSDPGTASRPFPLLVGVFIWHHFHRHTRHCPPVLETPVVSAPNVRFPDLHLGARCARTSTGHAKPGKEEPLASRARGARAVRAVQANARMHACFFCIFFSGRVEGCCMMVFWGGIFLPGGGLGKAEKDLWFGTPARARIVCEELPIKRCGKGRLESHLWCQTDFSRVNPQMT